MAGSLETHAPLSDHPYEELVRAADVARYLGVSVSKVRKLVRNDGLPHIPLTNVTQRCIRFRMSQVAAWVINRERSRS
jgi:excisionase family DNA binding protein